MASQAVAIAKFDSVLAHRSDLVPRRGSGLNSSVQRGCMQLTQLAFDYYPTK